MNSYLVVLFVAISSSKIRGQYFERFGESYNSYESQGLGHSNEGNSRKESIIIPIGSSRHHPIEYVDYNPQNSEEREPKTIHVESPNIPLNIIFNPRLNHLSVADKNDESFGQFTDEKYTYSEEDPIITYHEVNTPVFQESLQTYPCPYEDNSSNERYVDDNPKWQMSKQERPPC